MNIRFLRLCGILLFTSPEPICFDAIFSDRCIQNLKILLTFGQGWGGVNPPSKLTSEYTYGPSCDSKRRPRVREAHQPNRLGGLGARSSAPSRAGGENFEILNASIAKNSIKTNRLW